MQNSHQRNTERKNIYTLANAFLSIESMTESKLQKLCYYAKAWYLALYNKNIISEEFQAWIHGPVNPELFEKYKQYGWDKIPQITDINNIPKDFISFAQKIYDVYGKYTEEELEGVVHQEEPWIKARGGLSPWEACENEINEKDMRDFYRKIQKQTPQYEKKQIIISSVISFCIGFMLCHLIKNRRLKNEEL